MRRVLRVLGGVVLVSAIAAGACAAYIEATWRRDFSSTPLPAVTVSSDPEVIARGEYLFHAVAHCSSCHAPDAPSPGVPSGGPAIEAGPFGRFVPSNLTPDDETGLGRASDEAIARAIRSAVDREGTLAPMMLVSGGPMADEDLSAIVSYMRSLAPVRRASQEDAWGFAAKALSSRLAPRDEEPPPYAPPGEVSVARGAYLANGPAACVRCHTTRDPTQGFAPSGALFAGDSSPHVDRTDPDFEIVAPNLTPDPATGMITSWDEARFVERFRAGRAYAGSIMPWESYHRLTEEDVRSLYRYLRTLPAVANDVGPVRRPAGGA